MHPKNTSFLDGFNVDDGDLVCEEDVYDFKIDFMDTSDTRHHTDMKVSLFDIARPAKQKGEDIIFIIIQNGS